MVTTLTVTGPCESHSFRYFGIEGNRQARALADKFKRQGYTVTLIERKL